MRRRAVAGTVAAGLAAASLGACAALTSGPPDYAPRPGPHDRLERVLPEEVAEVQRLRAAGALETACAYLARLAAREPDNLPLALLAQDVEIEAGGRPALERLRADAARRLDGEADLVGLLLAARLEERSEEVQALLQRALELAPDSAWSHYALAHHEAAAGRWGQAAERLGRALLVDPGHLPARRLQTQLLVRGGPRDDAIDELERWLGAAAASPFYRVADLDAARLDLAHALLLEGRRREARRALEELDPASLGSTRGQQLLAAILQAEGQAGPALEAARRAAVADPGDPLPLVQQALLEEEWLGDPLAARASWEAVLAVAQVRTDLGALLLALRARAALERLALAPPDERAAAQP